MVDRYITMAACILAAGISWLPEVTHGESHESTHGIRHGIVWHETGRFGGWPANNGVWVWDDEILVGYSKGYYKYQGDDHSIDRDRPRQSVLSRSLDGGVTWTQEDPENYEDDGVETKSGPGNIRFGDPNFAMRVGEDQFFISYDRGKAWQGPYRIPSFGKGLKLTSRTEYIVQGEHECLFLLSAKEPRVQAGLQDRAFSARTTDGGTSFEFLGWMTGEPLTVRSVMPAAARLSDNQIVAVMRRRFDLRGGDFRNDFNWLDCYASDDHGKTWSYRSRVAYTDLGKRNGNPPSMASMKDGRLAVAYGYRANPYGIRAKISDDDGKSWSREIILRADGVTWDLGYCRTVQRTDGKLVTMYYYNTKERPEMHIAYTIWHPDEILDPDSARNASPQARSVVRAANSSRS